jgi:hypothetical protein
MFGGTGNMGGYLAYKCTFTIEHAMGLPVDIAAGKSESDFGGF